MANRTGTFLIGAALALGIPVAGAAVAQITSANVVIPRGKTSTVIASTIVGEQTRDYLVTARAGQTLKVTLRGASIVYFNVLAPGSNDEAIFIGSNEGSSFAGTLSVSGTYKIRVYQMRASARRGERGPFKLTVDVSGGDMASAPGNGLGGIAGMNSIAAFDAMTSRGFRNVDSTTLGNTQYGIYYNPATRVCAQLTMANGKVLAASDIRKHPNCR